MFLKLLTVISLPFLLSACEERSKIDSDGVSTGSTRANIQVTAESDGKVFIDTELVSTDDDLLVLSQKDQLWASNKKAYDRSLDTDNMFSALSQLSDTTVKLKKIETTHFGFLWGQFTGDVFYSGQLSLSEGNQYYISFLRDDFSDALNSQVSIPDEFDINAPLLNEIHSRSNALQITWSDSGTADAIKLHIFTICLNEYEESIDLEILEDNGSYTLEAEEFSDRLVGDCNTSIEVVKSRAGNLDPKLAGGLISGNRVQRTHIKTTD